MAFKKKLLLLHGDEIAGKESIDSIVSRFHIDGSERYADSILEGDNKALQKQLDDLEGHEDLRPNANQGQEEGPMCLWSNHLILRRSYWCLAITQNARLERSS